MEDLPSYLQYGDITAVEPGDAIFRVGDDLGVRPVCYVVAGLVKLVIPTADTCPVVTHAPPDTLFGIVEVMSGSRRLMDAIALEKTILYTWDHESYQTAHNISWELAFQAFTGMSRLLRILNAEYAEARR